MPSVDSELIQKEIQETCRVIEHIADIFILVDSDGIIVRANAALEVILGWKPKEVIGAKVEVLLPTEIRNRHQELRDLFYREPKDRDMNELVNLTALHKKGYPVPIDIKLSSVEIANLPFGIAIVRDVTIQRGLQKSLEDKYEIIKKTLSEKNHLLGIAAHDMRSPIGIIQNYAQILLSNSIGPLNKNQNEFIERIYQSSKFTMGLLEDTLDFSTIESGTMQLRREDFHFVELISEIMPVNKIYAEDKSIELKLNIASIDNIVVNADKRKLHQVLHNLINNAIKYSPSQSRININAGTNGKNITFSVEDQGVGIPKDDLNNLFQAFYRAKNKPTGGEKSTGLGLFITKRIVEAHEGKLFVNTVDGNGSIFSVDLPIIKD